MSQFENCRCGWGRSQHKGKNESRRGYRTTFGTWQAGCRKFVPMPKWDIVYSHCIGARDEKTAQSMVKDIITANFGPKEGERVWARIGFNFEVEERSAEPSAHRKTSPKRLDVDALLRRLA